jgi:ABC-type Zn uptake system ZnuABC Zn-binding protein ZnuA
MTAVFLIVMLSSSVHGLNVVCSIPDLVPIVKAVGGERVHVTSIMPAGSDPHSFTVSSSAMENIKNSDLIVLANSNLLHFEEKIKEDNSLKYLDFEDYEKYGATLDVFPKFGENPHGYWLKLDNGIAIAKAVKERLSSISPSDKEYFERNLEVFINEVESVKRVTKEIVKMNKLENRTCVAAVPGVSYIIQNMDMNVGSVLLGEGIGFASGSEIYEIVRKLKNSEYSCIVVPKFMENAKAGEIARQLSQDTEKPVIYVKFTMAGKNDSYTSLHLYNLIKFSVEIEDVANTNSNTGNGYLRYTIFILIFVAIAEAILILKMRVKK